jgi:hypothetical protein
VKVQDLLVDEPPRFHVLVTFDGGEDDDYFTESVGRYCPFLKEKIASYRSLLILWDAIHVSFPILFHEFKKCRILKYFQLVSIPFMTRIFISELCCQIRNCSSS